MRLFKKVLFLGLFITLLGACAPKPATLKDPTAPPSNFQRRIILVLENSGYYPLSGTAVTVETEAPTRLISPAGGSGRTDANGTLELIFEPLPHYEEAALGGGDVVVDFPIKAKLKIGSNLVRELDDRETFARYADPLYHGLNRDPNPGPTYYHMVLP